MKANSILTRACLQTLEDRRMFNFSPTADYAAGTNPLAVVVADLNGDTRPDIAVANYGSSDVSVLLGNANGTFQPAQNFATSAKPLSFAVGDFNGDSKPDLVTANAGNVSVLIGNGDGTFKAPANIDIGSLPASVAVGDFNADGKLDLAVASNVYYPGANGYYGYYPPHYNIGTNILIGTGSGSFGAPIKNNYYSTSAKPDAMSVALGDFNTDGKLDLAVAAFSAGGLNSFLGNGTGATTLNFNGYAFTGISVLSLVARDVSGDGNIDLVAVNPQSNSIVLALGAGTGSFSATQNLPVGLSPTSVAVADVNSDGKVDLLSTNGDGTLSVLLGAGSGTFKPSLGFSHSRGPHSLAIGDFNADGRSDLATSNGDTNNVSVRLNDGSWIALTSPSLSIGNATVTEGNIGTVNANFTVTLSAASTLPVTVHYATADGTATVAGGDYTATSGTVSFAPGQTSKTITVAVQGDRIAELTENFFVRLTDNTNAFLAGATGSGIIVDDEPRITIDPNASVTEGNTGTTPMIFTVRLAAAYDAPVSVNYSTAEGDTETWRYDNYYTFPPDPATSGVDFQGQTGTLTFAPGEIAKTIAVLVNGDRLPETSEALSIDLGTATGGIVSSGHALGFINDDEPNLNVAVGSVTEGNSGTKDLVYAVTLSAAYDAPITVHYATTDYTATASGGDYVPASGELTFAAGQTSKTITVQVKGDLLDEDNETVLLQLSGANSAHTENGYGYGLIIDDDAPPSVVISDVSQKEGNLNTTLFRFTVTLSAISGRQVSVFAQSANGTAKTSDNDYESVSGGVDFAPGQLSGVFGVYVKGDTKKESNETFLLKLTGTRNATIADSQAVGTIVDDDTKAKNFVGLTSGGSWSTSSNWSPSGVPVASDPVLISAKSVNLAASATIDDLTLLSGGSLLVAANGTRVLRASTLSIGANSNLNLNDNRLIVDYSGDSPMDDLLGGLYAGRIASPGGIVSSQANASNGFFVLGVAEAKDVLGISGSQTALFSGQTVDATSILVKYTYSGDANLDGVVNTVDFTALSQNFNKNGMSFSQGDLNFDGRVNALDYNALATTFGNPVAPAAEAITGSSAQTMKSSSSSLFSAMRVAGDLSDFVDVFGDNESDVTAS